MEKEANALVKKGKKVTIKAMERSKALKLPSMKFLKVSLPTTYKTFRIVNIVNKHPCGGTHVKNVKELGKIKMKAKGNEVIFTCN